MFRIEIIDIHPVVVKDFHFAFTLIGNHIKGVILIEHSVDPAVNLQASLHKPGPADTFVIYRKTLTGFQQIFPVALKRSMSLIVKRVGNLRERGIGIYEQFEIRRYVCLCPEILECKAKRQNAKAYEGT